MMKRIILTLTLLLSVAFVFAQERAINGVVRDADGEAVIGATVRVPNTSIGALTDLDGSFTLRVPNTATEVVVSYVGMDPVVVPLDSDYLEVNIGDQAVMIEDIVVTGYSQVQRTRFTGATANVDKKAVEDKSTSDISEALTGEVAGLTVINGNGQPGTPAAVRIRGFGSVNGNRAPVYVVDGVIYQGGLENVNPNDIASVTVLKDAAATALYGARGANGVIVVTTKRGTTGDSKIQVQAKYGSNYRGLPYYDVLQSPEEFIETAWEGLENGLGSAEAASATLFDGGIGIAPYYNIWDVDGEFLIDPATGQFYPNVNRRFNPERRRDEFFNPSDRKEVNVSLSGGEGKTNYRTSFGLLDEEGYFLASQFKRYTGRVDIGHQVKPWLRGTMNLNYSNNESNGPGQSGSSSVNGFFLERNAPPLFGILLRDQLGNTIEDPIFGGPLYDFGDGQFMGNARRFSSLSNIAAVNRYDTNVNNENGLSGQADLIASFLKNFTATARFGVQTQDNRGSARTNPYYGQASGSNGALSKTDNRTLSYTALQMVGYGNQIGDHEFSINAAHENQYWELRNRFSSGIGLADPFTLELRNVLENNPGDSFTRDFALESYFAFGDYSFKDKYFLNASIRRDGSSRFAEENRWGTFPAVGIGWVASEEEFLQVDAIDFLRLRASYGETGDQGDFSATSLYRGGGDLYNVGVSPTGTASFVFSTPVDPNITWESVNQYNVGLDVNAFSRLSASFDYFNKRTVDLFFDRRTGPSAGIALIRVNDGELLNEGLEFDVNGEIIKQDNFFVNLGINGSTLRNELLTSPIDPATGLPKAITVSGSYGISEGKSVYDFYTRAYAGVNADNGLSQWVQFYDDVNSNGMVDDGEGILDLVDYVSQREISGETVNLMQTITTESNDATLHYTGESGIPDVFGATRLNVGWKGISVTGQLLYSFGGYGRDGNYQALMDDADIGGGNWHEDIRNRWMNPGDITNIPALTGGQGSESGNQNASSTRFLTKRDYLLLNNVRLNYELPKTIFDKIGLQGAQFWLSGDNLWSQTERSGYFPFASESGIPNRESYDPLSTVTTGLNVTF